MSIAVTFVYKKKCTDKSIDTPKIASEHDENGRPIEGFEGTHVCSEGKAFELPTYING